MSPRSVRLFLILSQFPVAALAVDCQREDIDHYLDRGFTPAQVLELCRSSTSVDNDQSPRVSEPEQAQWQEFLRGAIAGYAVRLDATSLRYTRELCVPYDRPNLAEQRKKACGELAVRIARDGLSVSDSRRKFLFWGRDEVVVTGQIERDYALGQDQMSAFERSKLAEELEQGEQTAIPVRPGIPLSQVEETLRAIAR